MPRFFYSHPVFLDSANKNYVQCVYKFNKTKEKFSWCVIYMSYKRKKINFCLFVTEINLMSGHYNSIKQNI